MDTKKAVSQLAAFSFTCGLVFYSFVHDKLLAGFSTNPLWAKSLIELLSAVGFYAIIFEVFFTLYTRFFTGYLIDGWIWKGSGIKYL
jgi:hypothetical protein